MRFEDRLEAGEKLAEKLKEEKIENGIILAIPRGGVVIGDVLARELNLPLDIVVTKKLGAPGNPEFAIGAMGPDGEISLDQEAAASYGISDDYLNKESKRVKTLIKEKIKNLRGDKDFPNLFGRTVILTDDGLATGHTMEAAIEWVKMKKPLKIIVAVPVSARDTEDRLKGQVNQFICLHSPLFFGAVGGFYDDFNQVEDDEVKRILKNYHV